MDDKIVRIAGVRNFNECPLPDATHYECRGMIFPADQYIVLCETIWGNGRPRCTGLVLVESTHTIAMSECKTCAKDIIVNDGTWKHTDTMSTMCAPEYEWSPLALPCLDDKF